MVFQVKAYISRLAVILFGVSRRPEVFDGRKD